MGFMGFNKLVIHQGAIARPQVFYNILSFPFQARYPGVVAGYGRVAEL